MSEPTIPPILLNDIDQPTCWSSCLVRQALPASYGVETRPLLVATIQRWPQKTMESTFPSPGTVSPRRDLQTPLGPSKTATPLTTSRIVQPSIVFGLVSCIGASLVRVRISSGSTLLDVFCCSTVARWLAGGADGVSSKDGIQRLLTVEEVSFGLPDASAFAAPPS